MKLTFIQKWLLYLFMQLVLGLKLHFPCEIVIYPDSDLNIMLDCDQFHKREITSKGGED